ncbi:MAG: electron transfer flavoprotein subunit alpha/FixB family protein [Pseudomonadota bacterium]
MTTLLIAEHDNKTLNPATAKTMSAASALQAPVDILVAGHNCADVAQQAAKLTGCQKIIHADAPHLEHHLAEEMAQVITALMEDYTTAITPATTNGKNFMPRVAAALDVMQLSDITDVLAPNQFERPIYAGNALQIVESTDEKRVITVRTTKFPAVEETGQADVELLELPEPKSVSQYVSENLSQSDRPELASASIVVSGGRALGSKENFEKYIEPLAQTLGAAIGASRAAVDAGYISNDYQVGQTGKVVAPDLYIAIGISGAIQHLAGIKDAQTIVAINKDEEAPIFQIADYSLVGDLFELVPQLQAALENR